MSNGQPILKTTAENVNIDKPSAAATVSSASEKKISKKECPNVAGNKHQGADEQNRIPRKSVCQRSSIKMSHRSSSRPNAGGALKINSAASRIQKVRKSLIVSATKANCASSLPPKIAMPRLPLQRQNTTILNFRKNKSLSQMDFKEARRCKISEMGSVSSLILTRCQDTTGIKAIANISQRTVMNKLPTQKDCYYVLHTNDFKMAAFQMACTIVLDSFRKRRDKIKHSRTELDNAKQSSTKTKAQLELMLSVYHGEQRRNSDLSSKLKDVQKDINKTKSKFEELEHCLFEAKAEKSALLQERDTLNEVQEQTRSNLFKTMTTQRKLQMKLSAEQRNVQQLQDQHNELLNKVYAEEKVLLEMKNIIIAKKEKMLKAKEDSKARDKLLEEIKKKDLELSAYAASNTKLSNEVEALQSEIHNLQTCLADTLGKRLKESWNNSGRDTTYTILKWAGYIILPDNPRPRISSFPFGFGLKKTLGFVKR